MGSKLEIFAKKNKIKYFLINFLDLNGVQRSKLVPTPAIAEMEKEGIEGKTFLEVGCGPCPIGQQLAKKGAKKIYGLDISSEMIEAARKHLTDLKIIDKFELVCFDIFDENF